MFKTDFSNHIEEHRDRGYNKVVFFKQYTAKNNVNIKESV